MVQQQSKLRNYGYTDYMTVPDFSQTIMENYWPVNVSYTQYYTFNESNTTLYFDRSLIVA